MFEVFAFGFHTHTHM